MTCSEAIEKFGLPASAHYREEIRELLADEIERERNGGSSEEVLRVLCLQLFSLGFVEDSLLIWDAKTSSFDADCGLDIQFLCGAGLASTKEFLAHSKAPSARSALERVIDCEQAGDFAEWTPQTIIDQYRTYHGL